MLKREKTPIHINQVHEAIKLHAQNDPNKYGPPTKGDILYGELKGKIRWSSLNHRLSIGDIEGLKVTKSSIAKERKKLGVTAPPTGHSTKKKTKKAAAASPENYKYTREEVIDAYVRYYLETGKPPRFSYSEKIKFEISQGDKSTSTKKKIKSPLRKGTSDWHGVQMDANDGQIKGIKQGTDLKEFFKGIEDEIEKRINPANFTAKSNKQKMHVKIIFAHLSEHLKRNTDLSNNKTTISGWEIGDLRSIFEQRKVMNLSQLEQMNAHIMRKTTGEAVTLDEFMLVTGLAKHDKTAPEKLLPVPL